MILGQKTRVGNFYLRKKKDGKGTVIILGAISGEWELRFAPGNKMFHFLDQLEINDETYMGIHTWITTVYTVSHVVDGKFMRGLMELINEFIDRSVEEAKEEANDVDEEKILRELRDEHEIADILMQDDELRKADKADNEPIEGDQNND
jgi:hypothetical protein